MNKHILNSDIQLFIDNNLFSDINTLLLKHSVFNGVSIKDIAEQIEAKKRCRSKLPAWFKHAQIYYPNKLNIEQTSSEITADYKSQLLQGNSIIDLTGGFGVDCFYFSKRFKQVTHCELNKDLSEIAAHNFKMLNAKNIQTIALDGLEYLQTTRTTFDWIYIDPSRRHDSKGKVFMLADCLPNVPENIQLLWNYSKNILIKTSPLLDISIGLNELQHVKTIHIVAVNNDVKELLWVLEHGYSGTVKIKTSNLKTKHTEYFEFILQNEPQAETSYSLPLTYLYEPNAAVMKSGGFNSVAHHYQLEKLHKHSHLYTGNALMHFPGRVFKIISISPYNKQGLKNLNLKKANITIRNFPENVETIRKKTGIKDGGDDYLFFTTDMLNEKLCIVCKKA